jgi:predicted metalloprotease with PDZ domain
MAFVLATSQETAMLLALALAAQSFTYTLPRSPAQADARPQQESRQGWLGVSLAIEEGDDRPLTVSEVSGGSPAEHAGLQQGDRLIALDGRALASYEDLIEVLREHGPGREVALTARRGLAVELDERGWGEAGGPRLGVHLAQHDDDEGDARWVVSQVEQGWPAARAGVQAGDRIVALAGSEPADFEELQSLLAGVGPQEELELVIERDLHVRLGERPGEAATPTPFRRFETAPDGEGRSRLLPPPEIAPMQPAEPRAGAADLERQLREEINGLNQELRALREELRTLRRELAAMRER